MTPRLTSSNRKLRTAAIATLVAVSTAISGVTPAFAADKETPAKIEQPKAADGTIIRTENPNPDVAAGLYSDDGSLLQTGTVKTVEALKAESDNLQKTLDSFGKTADTDELAKTFALFNDPSKPDKGAALLALDDTEHGALVALQARYAAILATLKNAAQIQADATATAQNANNADSASLGVWNKVSDEIAKWSGKDRQALNDKIDTVNKNNRTGLANIPLLSTTKAVTPGEAMLVATAIQTHKNAALVPTADKDDKHYVERHYAAALKTLWSDAFAKSLLAPFDENADGLIAGQLTDTIPAQVIAYRSRAQVEALRLLAYRYYVASRLIELHRNSALDPQKVQTVDAAYMKAEAEAKTGMDAAFVEAMKNLKDGTDEVNDYFEQNLNYRADKNGNRPNIQNFKGDLANTDDPKTDPERQMIISLDDIEAVATFKRISKNREWRNLYKTAKLQDDAYFAAAPNTPAAKQKAADEAKRIQQADDNFKKLQGDISKQTKDAVAKAKQINELTNKIGTLSGQLEKSKGELAASRTTIDQLKGQLKNVQEQISQLKSMGNNPGEGGNTPKPNPKQTPEPDKDGNSSKETFAPIAIVAVVLAIIAAIAGNFPALLAALPKV